MLSQFTLAVASSPLVTELAAILSAVAKLPNPKLLLALLALDAPVPPLAIAKSVPDQFELLIVELPPIAVKPVAAVEPSPTYNALVSVLYINSPAAGVQAFERFVPLFILIVLEN